jgi:hypothetical protein
MDGSTIAAIVASAALVLNIILSVRGGAWGLSDRLSSMEQRIMGAVVKHKTSLDDTVDQMRQECDEKVELAERRFGETVTAMQNKIHEFETWTRDTFVRRGSLGEAVTRLEQSVADRDIRLEKRFDRLEAKFDAIMASKSTQTQ